VLRYVFEEATCEECDGDGCLDGDPSPADDGLCECLTCPECSGSGVVSAVVCVEELPAAA